MRYALSVLLLFCCICASSAKEFLLLNYTQKDGLPSNNVYDIYQDNDGYMWFATDKGVSRYNGLTFQNFTNADGLPGNTCYYFRKDSKDRMWIGMSNGSPVFYKDGKWFNAKNTPYLRMPFSGGVIGNIVENEDSSLTLIFQNRGYFAVIKNDSTHFYSLYNCPYLKENNIPVNFSLYDIRYYDRDHFRIVFGHFDLIMDKNYQITQKIPHEAISFHIVGREKEYYHTHNQVLSLSYQHVMNFPKRFFEQGYLVNRLFEHGKEQFICTNNGLFLGQDTFLKGSNVTTVFVDRSGYYWVSTAGNGVFKLSNHFHSSKAFLKAYEGKVNFAGTSGNTLLFSTVKRNIYRLQQGYPEELCDFDKRFGKTPIGENIGHLILDDDYFDFTGEKIMKLEGIKTTRPLLHSSRLKSFNVNINALFFSGKKILLKERGGICFSPDGTKEFFRKNWQNIPFSYLHIPDKTNVMKLLYGCDIDTAGQLWFSSLNGNYKITNDSCSLIPQLGNHCFVEMAFLKNYLIGITMQNQLMLCRDYNAPAACIDSDINNDCVWDKLYKINDYTLLISTNNYYRIFQLNAAEPKGYSIKVLENQFVPQLSDFIYSNDSLCYFFKEQSVFILPVRDFLYSDPAPVCNFTKLKTSERIIPCSGFPELDYNESRTISINYSTISLYADKIRYEYAVSSDKDSTEKWQESGPGTISLTNIGYGAYSVRIRAKTYGGTYSAVSTMKFVIGRPFWLQWWFFMLIFILLALVVFLIIFYLLRRKAKEKEREIRFIKSEFTALNALMNPHFVFNSLNSVQSLINKKDLQSASEYIRTISDLIRQNMYNISSDLVSLDKEILLVENYLKLEKLRFKEKLNYTIEIDETTDTEMVMVPPLIIQPLVENAIKYGIWQTDKKDGLVEVKVYSKEEDVFIDVKDNGRGLYFSDHKNGNHQSTAVNNIRKRMEQLSQIHNKHFFLSIEEVKDEQGEVRGVMARICIIA